MESSASVGEYLESARRAQSRLAERSGEIQRISEMLVGCLRGSGKVLTCGNGGSAAEAMHLAEELIGRYRRLRRPLSAICLNADATALTCIANDWGYEEVFARQVEGHGRAGDLLIALSTSGKSPSIISALERARRRGVATIGLLGPSGSVAEDHCDACLTFDAATPASHVQEMHLVVIHAMLERIDAEFAE